eukprot:jgi/Chlat1/7935/Chrsp68S07359
MAGRSATLAVAALALLAVAAIVLAPRRRVTMVEASPAAAAAVNVDTWVSDVEPFPHPPMVTVSPLIGILTQPLGGETNSKKNSNASHPGNTTSYIAASYVKFVEMAGGRAVPIFHDAPDWDIERRFRAVNGIIFPGGDASLEENSTFFQTGKKLLEMAMTANDAGDYFPIQATCLGYELLVTAISQNHTLFENFHAEDDPAPLIFLDQAANSRFFSHVPSYMLPELSGLPLAMENHELGVTPETFYSTPSLAEFFRPLSVSVDLENKTYISTVEARNYPITGTQWHPEKNAFEFGLDKIPHTLAAIKLTQAVANYFVSDARRSSHKPKDEVELNDLLVYNYPIIYTGRKPGSFFQMYHFNGTSPWNMVNGTIELTSCGESLAYL